MQCANPSWISNCMCQSCRNAACSIFQIRRDKNIFLAFVFLLEGGACVTEGISLQHRIKKKCWFMLIPDCPPPWDLYQPNRWHRRQPDYISPVYLWQRMWKCCWENDSCFLNPSHWCTNTTAGSTSPVICLTVEAAAVWLHPSAVSLRQHNVFEKLGALGICAGNCVHVLPVSVNGCVSLYVDPVMPPPPRDLQRISCIDNRWTVLTISWQSKQQVIK